MKNYIYYKKHKIHLNFEPQLAPSGRMFRLSGTKLVLNKPSVWIDGMLFHGTIYTFRYLDKDEFFSLEYDPKNKFIQKN